MGKEPPKRRKTMEVQISWLEEVPAKGKDGKDDGKKKKPPRMPGASATVPPLPVTSSEPPTRNTIPVKDEWLEIVDEDEGEKKKPAT